MATLANVGGKLLTQSENNLLTVRNMIFVSEGGGGGGGGGGVNGFSQSICLVNKTSFIKRNCKWLQKQ